MSLPELWFVLLVVLWAGFCVLEGFDFGVGALHRVVGRDDAGRGQALSTVGPVWDANEVWLVVAVAGTFAAFPAWYATMFSAYYPLFVLLLLALVVRGVALEFRGHGDGPAWRGTWSVATVVASLVAPFCVGAVLGGILHGLPLGSDEEFNGGLADLLAPYALLTGLTLVLLSLVHGATFLALRTTGAVRDRAARLGTRLAPAALAAVAGLAAWTLGAEDVDVPLALAAGVPVAAVALAGVLAVRRREGWAFAATAVGLAGLVAMLFVALHPRVVVSTGAPGTDLTVEGAAASSYSLTLMTVVAGVLLPVVLAYQGWSYHVLRRRVTGGGGVPAAPPRPRPSGDDTVGRDEAGVEPQAGVEGDAVPTEKESP